MSLKINFTYFFLLLLMWLIENDIGAHITFWTAGTVLELTLIYRKHSGGDTRKEPPLSRDRRTV